MSESSEGAADRDTIESWVRSGYSDQTCSHVIVVCDDFQHEDYPVFVSQKEDIKEEMEKYSYKNMQRIMEVYSMKMDIEDQLAERRAFHPEHE